MGIEIYDSVIVAALDRLIEEDLPNLRLLNVDAAIYLNTLKKMMSIGSI